MATNEVLTKASQSGTSGSQKPHRRWIPWVLAGAFAVIGILGWRAATQRQKEEQAMRAQQARAAALRPVPVVVGSAETRDFPVFLTGLGTVTAYNTVTIQPRVAGQIMKLFFQEGQHISAGQMLVQIDPRPYQVQLQQGQGQLAHDEAQLHDDLLNLARDQALFGGGVIPKQQLDTQQAAVAQLQGSIASDKAQIASAQLNLTYCKLTAPISGKAGLRMVDAGNYVQAGTGILVITQMQPIAVIFTLPEGQLTTILRGLRRGQAFRVEAYDRSDTHQIAAGRLLATDNLINPSTGTLRLKAEFTNQGGSLFPNEFVNVHIETEVLPHALLIPAAALQHGPSGDFVFVVNKDKTASVQPVSVDMIQGNYVVLRSGLQAGETVVTEGQDKLRAGSHLIPQAPSAPTPAAGAQTL